LKRIEFENLGVHQVLLAETEDPAEFGIHLRDAAAQITKSNADRCGLKNSAEAKVPLASTDRRNLVDDIHECSAPESTPIAAKLEPRHIQAGKNSATFSANGAGLGKQ
jgi:hypothetical protein